VNYLGGARRFQELVNSVLSFDADKVMDATRRAVNQGIDSASIIEDGLAKGLRIVGKKFEDGELFLMHLVAAAEGVQRALKELLDRVVFFSSNQFQRFLINNNTIAFKLQALASWNY